MTLTFEDSSSWGKGERRFVYSCTFCEAGRKHPFPTSLARHELLHATSTNGKSSSSTPPAGPLSQLAASRGTRICEVPLYG